MSRLQTVIQKRLDQSQKVFVGYVTAGDPDLLATKEICRLLAKSGVDIIELGIPFSDPLADGPTNQKAAQRALEKGVSLSSILDMAADLRGDGFETPLVLFSYCNPIYKMGFKAFAERAAKAGVDGVLCVDLPPEEAGDYTRILRNQGLDTIFLASPTSDELRLKLVDHLSSGFVYYVSRTGVTGVQGEISQTLEAEMSLVKQHITKPVFIGFGVSSPEQARSIARWGDGVVIGSAIVNRVEHWAKDPQAKSELASFVAAVRQALDEI